MITKRLMTMTKTLKKLRFNFSSNFKASDIEIELADDTSTPNIDFSTLAFGVEHGRHMLEIDFENGKWGKPQIRPFQDISLSPFNITLHYALTCFEGLKAYKDQEDNIRMFRPLENMERFNNSIDRLMLEGFDNQELLKCIEELLKVDKDFIPGFEHEGASLYVRPFAFGTEHTLGVKASSGTKIMVVTSPVGPYFPTGVKPVNLAVYRGYERGNPLSAAGFKIGSNYGPTCKISTELAEKGISQALWVHGEKILEVGACNIFFLLENENGEKEIITPPLDGSILPGITRKTLIEMMENEGGIPVTVRDFTVPELTQAFDEGRVIEIFGAGTAVTIVPVSELHIDGKVYSTAAKDEEGWDFAKGLRKRLLDIQYGVVEHDYSYLVKE